MRSSVDLPQPDGPTRTTNSPSAMSRSMPWMTLVLPNDFSMPVTRRYLDCHASTSARGGYQLFTAPAVSPPTM